MSKKCGLGDPTMLFISCIVIKLRSTPKRYSLYQYRAWSFGFILLLVWYFLSTINICTISKSPMINMMFKGKPVKFIRFSKTSNVSKCVVSPHGSGPQSVLFLLRSSFFFYSNRIKMFTKL